MDSIAEHRKANDSPDTGIATSGFLYGAKCQHEHEFYVVDGVLGTFDWKLKENEDQEASK